MLQMRIKRCSNIYEANWWLGLCNVACTVQKLGQQAYMITQLGNDAFGDSIIETISSIGVDVSKVYRTNEANTALAFVSLTKRASEIFLFIVSPLLICYLINFCQRLLCE